MPASVHIYAFLLLLGTFTSAALPSKGSSLPSMARQQSTLCPAVRDCLRRLDNGEKCDVLPLPPGAAVDFVGEKGFTLQLHRRGLWTYYDGTYYSLMMAAGDRFVFVDFPDSVGSNKPDGSRTRTTDAAEEIIGNAIPNRIDMVYSHGHFDHIGAGRRFFDYMSNKYPDANIFVWGTQAAKRMIDFSTTQRAPAPTGIVHPSGLTLNISDDLQLQLTALEGHSRGDLMSYVPRHNDQPSVMLLTDSAYPGFSPPFNFGITTDLGAYMRSQRKVLDFDIDIFSGGHTNLGTREDIVTNLEFTEDVIDAMAFAMGNTTMDDFTAAGLNRFMEPSSAEYGNILWVLGGVFRNVQENICERRVIEKWGCRLGAVDIHARSLCFTATNFLLNES